MTHMQRLIETFTAIGIPFELTDDSEESDLDESLDTVVVIEEKWGPVCFLFRRDGSFKEVAPFGVFGASSKGEGD